MKHSSTWFALILIASALLLSAGKNGIADSPNQTGQSAATPKDEYNYAKPRSSGDSQQPSAQRTSEKSQAETYNYYGDFNYRPRESGIPWEKIGQVATILATVAMAVFAGGLWKTSIWQWREIKRQAKAAEEQVIKLDKTLVATDKAAEAAKRSADAAVASSAPYPYLTEIWLYEKNSHQDIMRNSEIANPDISYIIWNFGKTPAFLTEVCWEHAFGLRLPDVPQYQNVAPVIASEIIPAETATGPITARWQDLMGRLLVEENVAHVRRMETRLYVYGYFRYRDVFERVFRVGFVYIVDVRTGNMIPANPDTVPGYIYRREEI
jgi:hypothetical protein